MQIKYLLLVVYKVQAQNCISSMLRFLLEHKTHLQYCFQLWCPQHEKEMDLLELVQRRSTKMLRAAAPLL